MSGTPPGASQELWYTCSYVPEEIILAAGFRPCRFLPESNQAEAWIHPNTCGYVKSILAAGLAAGEPRAAGIVIANSCDAMRRLHDLWTAYVPAVPAFFLDMPRKRDADSIAFFASELRRLGEWLHTTLPGSAPDKEKLRAAVQTCNQIRALMGKVFLGQRDVHADGFGTRVFDLCLAGTRQARSEFVAEIDGFLATVPPKTHDTGKRRIVIAGGLVNQRHVVAEIENAGGHVVALDTCIGLRHYQAAVAEDAPDLILDLARRYLTKPSCARMEGLEERIGGIQSLAEDVQADGVVFCSLKFCDPCLYDVPLVRATLRESGIPFLWLEHDYAWSGLGQLRTRIAAFLELTR